MSLNLKALRDERADLLRQAETMFASVAAEGRTLNADELARDDQAAARLVELNESITRAERHQEQMRGLTGTTMLNPSDPNKFSSLGEMLMSVAKQEEPRSGFKDPRLKWGSGNFVAGPTGMGEGIDADGGFIVGQDLMQDLLKPTWTTGEVASRIRRVTVGANSNGIVMNGVDETSRANGSRWGGVRAWWTGEAALITASAPKFRQIKMSLEKLTAMCYATSELLADASALQAVIQQSFTEEMTFKVEDAIFAGTGSGMPLGFLNSPAVITVSKEGSQANGTILSRNIINMWARMPARMRSTAVWYVNQDCEPQLFELNTPIKNVAGTENVGGYGNPEIKYVPPGTGGNKYGTLMGRPVIPVEYCATLGTAGDIVLTDPSTYIGIDKGGVDQQTSIHVRFLYDEMAFRFIYRFNGQSIWNSPITPYKGSNTLSPVIVLQTR